MTWSDVTREHRPRVVRQFGLVCFAVFGAAGLFQAMARSRPTLGWSLVAFGVLCLTLGWVAPRMFRWVFTGAMLLAFPVGFVVSQVMLAFLFFVVFFAVGLFLRARRWDAMMRRRKDRGASYWERKETPADPGRYLRQY